jgi:hypothetical protein
MILVRQLHLNSPDQLLIVIFQSKGMYGRAKATIVAAVRRHRTNAIRKRERIFGTSKKKFDRLTSFTVAPHVILYENKCARMALLRWIERPPKKMKL